MRRPLVGQGSWEPGSCRIQPLSSLIPVRVTGIQQPCVRTAENGTRNAGRNRLRAEGAAEIL